MVERLCEYHYPTLSFQAALAGDKNELGAAFKEVSFPIDASSSAPVPRLLRCVPEFFVENLCEHLLLARRFCPGHFEESGADALASVLNFILASVHLLSTFHIDISFIAP